MHTESLRSAEAAALHRFRYGPLQDSSCLNRHLGAPAVPGPAALLRLPCRPQDGSQQQQRPWPALRPSLKLRLRQPPRPLLHLCLLVPQQAVVGTLGYTR